MTRSEMSYLDSVLIGPSLLAMNQYFNNFFQEYYVLWLCLVIPIDMNMLMRQSCWRWRNKMWLNVFFFGGVAGLGPLRFISLLPSCLLGDLPSAWYRAIPHCAQATFGWCTEQRHSKRPPQKVLESFAAGATDLIFSLSFHLQVCGICFHVIVQFLFQLALVLDELLAKWLLLCSILLF